MNKLVLAALLAALFLTACGSPPAGSAVEIRTGAVGCRTWSNPNDSWLDCSQVVEKIPGVVEDHPFGLGHDLNGRVRVRTATFGPLWFEPGDLTPVPK